DLGPVGDARPAERVGADPDAGGADRVQVDDVCQLVDVAAEEVVALTGGARPGERHAPDLAQSAGDELVRARRDRGGGLTVRGPAVRRVVLEASVGGRIV